MSDLDVLKEIPGYKAILKSVLKSQIHLLMEQLSEHTGEESIILTASVHDGSLSHLGSSTGKGFLEGRDEIKSQFLGYCLKTYHKMKTHEPQKPYQRTHPSPRSPAQLPTPPAKRARPQPVSLTMVAPIDNYPQSNIIPAETSDSMVRLGSGIDNSSVSIKTEQSDNQSTDISHQEFSDSVTSEDKSIPESVHLTHTQTSSAENDNDTMEDSAETEKTDVADLSTIKVEQVEDELEITGVEMAAGNLDNWGKGQSGYGDSDTSFDQSAEQASYNQAVAKTSVHQTSTADALSSAVYVVSHLNKSLSAQEMASFRNSAHICPFCNKIFGAKTDLARHVLIHTGDKPHKCSICQKDFRLPHHLRKHKFNVHKIVD